MYLDTCLEMLKKQFTDYELEVYEVKQVELKVDFVKPSTGEPMTHHYKLGGSEPKEGEVGVQYNWIIKYRKEGGEEDGNAK